MSTAYLVLCHQPAPHLLQWAKQQPQNRFYVHFDAKTAWSAVQALRDVPNIRIVSPRIDVRWAGFSMIVATLVLMQTALSDRKNRYFHLMSGACLPLQTAEYMAAQMDSIGAGCLHLECHNQPHLRYRVRFNLPHADTSWQRSLHGKLLTKGAQCLDKLLPTKLPAWSGSQWFSADRVALQYLFDNSLGDMTAHFEHKLCPDEHFFQHIVQQCVPSDGSLHWINDNRRYIQFAAHANHPKVLTQDEVAVAQGSGYWFARKVPSEILQHFWDDATIDII